MKVVAFLINQLRKSGPVNVLYDLVANIDRTRYKPIVIKLMADDPDRNITVEFEEIGIEVISFKFSFWDLELRTKKVAHIIGDCLLEKGVSLLHSHGYHPLLISSYVNLDIIKLDTQHCISIDSFRASRGRIIGTYMHYRYVYRLKKISAAVSISKSVKDYYSRFSFPILIHMIYNGVNIGQFELAGHDKQYWKKKLGFENVNLLIVVVGHLSKLKDPLLIVKAYVSMVEQGYLKKSLLLFCGTGSEEKKCRVLTQNYPQVIYKGYVFNVADYLKAADISICASHSEGFGLNYIEALASGALVLSSKIPTFNEFSQIYPLLQKYQFDKGNQKELEVLLGLVEKEIENIDDIKDDVIMRFSSNRMAKEYMELYDVYLSKQSKIGS